MKLPGIHRLAGLVIGPLLMVACSGDGGDDNSVNNGTIINGDVETLVFDNNGNLVSVNGADSNGATNDNEEADDVVATERQNDCRRPDVFRVGLPNPGAALVLFPESVPLPERSGLRRMIQVPDGNPFYVDSLVVTELGTVSVSHVDQGPEHSVMELFELNLQNSIVSIADFGDFDQLNGRGRIDVALLPGVYCFYIADSNGTFAANTELTVDYQFTPP